MRKIITLSMERGYRGILRRYPNSKVRVAKTRYSKFCGLIQLAVNVISLRQSVYSLKLEKFFENDFVIKISFFTLINNRYVVLFIISTA